MTHAVIETGGKQYLVSPKDKVTIEKLELKVGESITFDKVLLVADGSKVSLGKPYLTDAKVKGKVIAQQKADKLVVFKYRAKSRYRRKYGHRQQQTVVEIESIV
jgi:large subunit ribosomal protein L21